MKHDHLSLDAITDVTGVKVGHWSDRRGATGCTVVLCPPEGAVGGVDVRGGAPGTRETDALRPGRLVERAHAIVLAGGSAFGLDAAGGVMRYLEEQGVGYAFGAGTPRVGVARIPMVAAACIFDLGIGRATARPDADSGYRAAKSAKGGAVDQGSVGAGTGATVAHAGGRERQLKGGVGTACERGPGGLLVGALAAVNAAADIFDPATGRVIAAPRADGGGFMDGWELVRTAATPEPQPGEHTTLAVVATNARLTKEQTNRVAAVAHDGFARAVRPAHTMVDGDTVFALATGELPVDEPRLIRAVEALAARAVERAIVRGVLCATALAGVPSAQEWLAESMG
ncbi:MAG: P1 family peptidase [Dehalococcoidia bacterium]